MSDVGLNPDHSRLALPGCSQARLAFCSGPQHDCAVLVNERGEVVAARQESPSANRAATATVRSLQLVN
jgi:hypothetical protein